MFYHKQDAENIRETRQTYLYYGPFLRNFMTAEEWNSLEKSVQEARYEEITIPLMRNEVIPVLEKHGITVTWDEDLRTRILLSNVDFFAEV